VIRGGENKFHFSFHTLGFLMTLISPLNISTMPILLLIIIIPIFRKALCDCGEAL
jgi:hypothetical protein